MSTSTMADTALFSEDGQTWHDGTKLSWTPDEAVTKLVIGTLEKDEGEQKTVSLATAIPPTLAEVYPRLTHLHLWGIEGLRSLPALPPGLKELDVRGCSNLGSLPQWPPSIEVLDVGGCTALRRIPAPAPAGLTRLFLNGCSGLGAGSIESVLESLSAREQVAPVVEIDASQCPGVMSIASMPRTLEKLVLRGCEELRQIESLPELTRLRHLNLSDCPKVTALPALPASLQYLQLHGADNLTDFIGQDIGPYDRGSKEQPNVRPILRSRMKFGREMAVSARAKLLLLGDGRGGKSTLIRRLQWDCLTPPQQADPANAHLRPDPKQPFTHMVEFGEWHTWLQVSESAATTLNVRAQGAGLEPPGDDTHRIAGTIQTWDFGGQEIYHQTHRLFASEGSVFLIVWSATKRSDEELLRDKPRGVENQDWLELNGRRSLDYWLDYLDRLRAQSANPNRPLKVLLVCTHCAPDAERPRWERLAPRHADTGLTCYYVDSLDDKCQDNPDYRKLVAAIRVACGEEAGRIGILKPAFYAAASQHVNDILRGTVDGAKRLMEWQEWSQMLTSRHAADGASAHALDASDVSAVTGYLHDAGHVFWLRGKAQEAVLVDQRWASSLIYQMLLPGNELGGRIVALGGRFYQSDLDADPHWRTLSTDLERSQLVGYMEQCGIIARIASREHHRDGQNVFLATEKWLLPHLGEVRGHLEKIETSISEAGGITRKAFWFESVDISEFEFRSLMAHLARTFGPHGTWFRTGFQVAVHDEGDVWCFEVTWAPTKSDGFVGPANARVVAPAEHVERAVHRIEAVFAADGSPFADEAPRRLRPKSLHDPDRPDDVDLAGFFTRHKARGSTPGVWDLAISSNGADETVVRPLREAIGLAFPSHQVKWYRDDPPKGLSPRELRAFIDRLGTARCMVLFVSSAYLSDDLTENPYCIRELADVVAQVASTDRAIDYAIVVYADGIDAAAARPLAVKALQTMEDGFLEMYNSQGANKSAFTDYLVWHTRYQAGRVSAASFFDDSEYCRIRIGAAGPDYTAILDRIRKALA